MPDKYPNYNNSRNAYAMSQMIPINNNSRYDFAMSQMPYNYQRKLNDFDEENEWANNNQIVRLNNNPYDYSVNMRATTPINIPKSYSRVYSHFNRGNEDGKGFFPLIRRMIANRKAKKQSSDDNKSASNNAYNFQTSFDAVTSGLRNLPVADSVNQYFQKKNDTPDYSGLNNYSRMAMQETPVRRYTPNHITGNLKFNPFDYTEQANNIQATAATAQNLAGRTAGGNLNMLMAHVSNLLSNINRAIGDARINAWKANEAQRMAVTQENRRADEFNANVDNTAEAAYTNSRNAQTLADKQNALNALQYTDQQKYARDAQYKRELEAKRNEMVNNIANLGVNAFERNRANTNQANNYWTDSFGRHHYIGANGPRDVDNNTKSLVAVSDGEWDKIWDSIKNDERYTKEYENLVKKFGESKARRIFMDYNNNLNGTV